MWTGTGKDCMYYSINGHFLLCYSFDGHFCFDHDFCLIFFYMYLCKMIKQNLAQAQTYSVEMVKRLRALGTSGLNFSATGAATKII